MTIIEAKKLNDEIIETGRDALIDTLTEYGVEGLWAEQSTVWDDVSELSVTLNKEGCFFIGKFKVGKRHRTFKSPLIRADEVSE